MLNTEGEKKMQNAEVLLKLVGITKSFGDFIANDHIDLEVKAGEVHALLGENGAGKTTLMNSIYGMIQPDEGNIYAHGKEVHIRSPKDALAKGIGMVHQHFMLVDVFSAAENVLLLDSGHPFSKKPIKKAIERLEALKKQYHIDVDIQSPVGTLSIGMQQKVEILKLLYIGADLLILDEPTAILPPQECDELFAIIESLKKQGRGVIFISHKLNEVLSISDRITILSKGRITGTIAAEDADRASVIRMMVGEDIQLPSQDHSQLKAQGQVLLRAEQLESKDNRGVQTLNGVSLSIHEGEIVGIAGVEGNGQIELAEVLSGVRKQSGGTVYAKDDMITEHRQQFIDQKIAYIPADRNTVGTIPDFPLYENWILRNEAPYKHGLLDYRSIHEMTQKAMKEFDVRARSDSERTADLSGGNLQKFIIARSLSSCPQVMICAYVTRGLDIKATCFIREKLLEARAEGVGILLLSSDMDELFALCDRILVLYRGQIAGEVMPKDYEARHIGSLMLGGVNA